MTFLSIQRVALTEVTWGCILSNDPQGALMTCIRQNAQKLNPLTLLLIGERSYLLQDENTADTGKGWHLCRCWSRDAGKRLSFPHRASALTWAKTLWNLMLLCRYFGCHIHLHLTCLSILEPDWQNKSGAYNKREEFLAFPGSEKCWFLGERATAA